MIPAVGGYSRLVGVDVHAPGQYDHRTGDLLTLFRYDKREQNSGGFSEVFYNNDPTNGVPIGATQHFWRDGHNSATELACSTQIPTDATLALSYTYTMTNCGTESQTMLVDGVQSNGMLPAGIGDSFVTLTVRSYFCGGGNSTDSGGSVSSAGSASSVSAAGSAGSVGTVDPDKGELLEEQTCYEMWSTVALEYVGEPQASNCYRYMCDDVDTGELIGSIIPNYSSQSCFYNVPQGTVLGTLYGSSAGYTSSGWLWRKVDPVECTFYPTISAEIGATVVSRGQLGYNWIDSDYLYPPAEVERIVVSLGSSWVGGTDILSDFMLWDPSTCEFREAISDPDLTKFEPWMNQIDPVNSTAFLLEANTAVYEQATPTEFAIRLGVPVLPVTQGTSYPAIFQYPSWIHEHAQETVCEGVQSSPEYSLTIPQGSKNQANFTFGSAVKLCVGLPVPALMSTSAWLSIYHGALSALAGFNGSSVLNGEAANVVQWNDTPQVMASSIEVTNDDPATYKAFGVYWSGEGDHTATGINSWYLPDNPDQWYYGSFYSEAEVDSFYCNDLYFYGAACWQCSCKSAYARLTMAGADVDDENNSKTIELDLGALENVRAGIAFMTEITTTITASFSDDGHLDYKYGVPANSAMGSPTGAELTAKWVVQTPDTGDEDPSFLRFPLNTNSANHFISGNWTRSSSQEIKSDTYRTWAKSPGRDDYTQTVDTAAGYGWIDAKLSYIRAKVLGYTEEPAWCDQNTTVSYQIFVWSEEQEDYIPDPDFTCGCNPDPAADPLGNTPTVYTVEQTIKLVHKQDGPP